MKKFIIAIFMFMAFGLPQLSYASSCRLTKTLYDSGKYQRAFKQAETYARYNNACAQYYLGLMYFNGQGVVPNTDKGNTLIEKAANKGFKPAIDFFKTMMP